MLKNIGLKIIWKDCIVNKINVALLFLCAAESDKTALEEPDLHLSQTNTVKMEDLINEYLSAMDGVFKKLILDTCILHESNTVKYFRSLEN